MADVVTHAWERLLVSLKHAGEMVTGPLGARDDRELAEGYRHVARVLSVALEMLLEKGDRARPEFTRWIGPHRKLFGDNPETVYDAAGIDPGTTYRITGRRGGCTYLGVVVYGTGPEGERRIVGHLDDVDLAVDDDGAFELWLAPDGSSHVPAGADVIRLAPDATDVMVRQYFADRSRQVEATYTISALPDPGAAPPLDPDTLAQRLDAVGVFVTGTLEVETTLSALMISATPARMRYGDEYVDAEGRPTDPPIDPAVVQRAMPSPSIQYSGSWADDLGDDEAVVVEGEVPVCRYWSIQLLSRWMESGDWPRRTVHLVGDHVVADEHGRFRAVVAHRDPGVSNWIDTTGWRSFNTVVRAIGRDEPTEIEFRRVSLDDL